MSKTFVYAGVSRLNGDLTLRFANDDSRVAHLVKVGHTDVQMVKLPASMTKEQAVAYLVSSNFANGNVEVAGLLTVDAKSKPVRVRTTKAKVVAKDKKLSIEQANALVLATMREVSEAEALERLCQRATKKRRSRKTVEAV